MAAHNIKNVDYLRQRANLTYEQSIALLDKFDGDITRALVELERQGALVSEASKACSEPVPDSIQFGTAAQAKPDFGPAYAAAEPESKAGATSKGRNFWDTLVELVIKGLRLRLIVNKKSDVIANLPVLYIIAGVIMAPHFAVLSVVLMFLCGYRVHMEKHADPDGDEKIRFYAARTSQSIINTVSSVTNSNASDKTNPDKQDSDTFTVE